MICLERPSLRIVYRKDPEGAISTVATRQCRQHDVGFTAGRITGSKPGLREITAGDDIILEHHLHCASFRRGVSRRGGIR